MDEDLNTAVTLLAEQLDLTPDEAEELLSILELVERQPTKSVLYGRNCNFSYESDCVRGAKRFWLNGKRVYEHLFVFIVIETSAGNRIVVEILPPARG